MFGTELLNLGLQENDELCMDKLMLAVRYFENEFVGIGEVIISVYFWIKLIPDWTDYRK